MNAKILKNQEVSSGYYKMILHSPGVARKGRAGQFIMLRIKEVYDPLLPRAFAIHKIIAKRGGPGNYHSIEILYQIVGRGTTLMSLMKPEEELYIIGPLGNGFTISHSTKRALIIAGGIGIAPMYFLADELKKEHIKTHLIIGGKEEKDILCIEEFRSLGVEIEISTEDGSLGKKDMATGLFRDLIEKEDRNFLKDITIYACGPNSMLQNIADLALKNSLNCQVSMEARMACGIGSCLGCVVKTKDKESEGHSQENSNGTKMFSYERVCKEGPIFDVKNLIWE